MQNPQPSKVLWPTYRLPIQLAFASGNLSCAGPKESPFNLVEGKKTTRRYVEQGDVENCLGSKHGFDKGTTPGDVDALAIPRDKLSGHLILRRLEVHSLELPN
jgi:hypothetical protein